MNREQFVIAPGTKVDLKDYDPASTRGLDGKTDGMKKLAGDVERMAEHQAMLYAENKHALLIILQAMDTSGKDGVIRHVLSGFDPIGLHVHAFKQPSSEELDHDFLWRCTRRMPERGNIGVFNRSYYEEVLVVRVHPELLERQHLPDSARSADIWNDRFNQINAYEKYLVDTGTVVMKFFLHLSKDEQRKRLLSRIDMPDKNWKFSLADVEERVHWDKYMHAYEDALSNTSTEHAPWHIVPADNKWYTRAVIADLIADKLKSLDLAFPTLGTDRLSALAEAREVLRNER